MTDRESLIVALRTETNRLKPGSKAMIETILTAFLCHYQRPEDQAIEREMLHQWVSVLNIYPAWVVDAAAIWWLTGDAKRKRPVPGQLRAQCEVIILPIRTRIREINRDLRNLPARRAVSPPARLESFEQLRNSLDAVEASGRNMEK